MKLFKMRTSNNVRSYRQVPTEKLVDKACLLEAMYDAKTTKSSIILKGAKRYGYASLNIKNIKY